MWKYFRLDSQPSCHFPRSGWGWWAQGGWVWVWEIHRSWRKTGWTAPDAALSDEESTREKLLKKLSFYSSKKWLRKTEKYNKTACTCIDVMETFMLLNDENRRAKDKTLCYSVTSNKQTHTTGNVSLTSFISLLGTDLMIFPVKKQQFISVKYHSATFCFCLSETQISFHGKAKVGLIKHFHSVFDMLYCANIIHLWVVVFFLVTLYISFSQNLPYTVPRFTSGNILSRNWDSMLCGDRKSARSWLLLSSGCCRSFCKDQCKHIVLWSVPYYITTLLHNSDNKYWKKAIVIKKFGFVFLFMFSNCAFPTILFYICIQKTSAGLWFYNMNWTVFAVRNLTLLKGLYNMIIHEETTGNLLFSTLTFMLIKCSSIISDVILDVYLEVLLELLPLRCEEFIILGTDDSLRRQLSIWKGACMGWK